MSGPSYIVFWPKNVQDQQDLGKFTADKRMYVENSISIRIGEPDWLWPQNRPDASQPPLPLPVVLQYLGKGEGGDLGELSTMREIIINCFCCECSFQVIY